MARFRLPADLARRLGMTELRRSLETKDLAEARRRCLLAATWFSETVQQLRQMPDVTRSDLEAAAVRFFETLKAEVDRPRDLPDAMDREVGYQVEESRNRIEGFEAELMANEFGPAVQAAADEVLQIGGVSAATTDHRTLLKARQLAARALIAQMEFFIHQLRSPASTFEPGDKLFGSPVDAAVPSRPIVLPSRPANALTLEAATDSYLRKMKARGVGQSQHDEVARVLRWLCEQAGPQTSLEGVDKAFLREFRDDLQRIDVTLRGRKAPFRDRLTNVVEHQLRSDTALKYWHSVQAFFRWSVSEGLLEDDPSAGLRLEKRKGQTRRSPEPFSELELRKLFGSPLYAGHQSPRKVNEPGPCRLRGGYWWSGVLALFTGLRAGELSQLLPGDFDFDSDIPHLKVREEDETGKRVKRAKSVSSVRDVPLHPILLKLGLREFVELRRKRYPKDRVFREFRLGSGDRTSDGMTKFWGAYLKEYGIWKPQRATHVFRHTVTAALRARGASNEDIGAVLGHSGQTITAGYGGAQSLSRKFSTLKRLDYGFDVLQVLGGEYRAADHAT